MVNVRHFLDAKPSYYYQIQALRRVTQCSIYTATVTLILVTPESCPLLDASL
jgi:hypothetical protein